MDRAGLLEMWNESWTTGPWIAPWSQALDNLTAEQAAQSPVGSRHSIWQLVTHVCFWRAYTLNVLAGGDKPSDDEIAVRQFARPHSVTESAWAATRAEIAASHEDIRAAIASEANSLDRLKHHLVHDAYHLGQIMSVRAALGLKPLL